MSTLAPLTIYQQLAFEQILLPPVAIADTTWSAIFSVWNGTTGLMTGSAVVLADRSVRLRLNQGQTILAIGKYVYYLDMKSADRSRSFDFRGIANVTLPAPSQPPPVEPGSVPAWLTDVVSGAIASHNANLAAHPGLAAGGGGVIFELVAGVALSGDRAVIANSAGQAIYADGANPSHVGRVIGITVNAAASGTNVAIAPSGELTETSWNWTPGAVFVGANGVLTQAPPASGFTQAIAVVITPTRIRVQILSPTLRQ